MNDPTTQMGLQLGQGAMKVGQEYMEHNVGILLPDGGFIDFANDQHLGQPLRLSGLAQTLLRRYYTLCPPQAPHSAVPFPASPLVTVAKSSFIPFLSTIEFTICVSEGGY